MIGISFSLGNFDFSQKRDKFLFWSRIKIVDLQLFNLCPFQVHGIHERALEIFDPCVLPLEKALKLKVRLGPWREQRNGLCNITFIVFQPVEKNNLNVNIFSILMEEVLQEVRD